MSDYNIEITNISEKIYIIRGQRVMLDRDLAKLYQVDTKVLNQAVKRNKQRFPDDFMFQLSRMEIENLRSQIVTANVSKKSRALPHAFTENGVAMLSTVLNSNRAIDINIQIMRTFVKLRNMLDAHKDLRDKIDHMERQYDQQFKVVFEAIKHILYSEENPKQFGFIKE